MSGYWELTPCIKDTRTNAKIELPQASSYDLKESVECRETIALEANLDNGQVLICARARNQRRHDCERRMLVPLAPGERERLEVVVPYKGNRKRLARHELATVDVDVLQVWHALQEFRELVRIVGYAVAETQLLHGEPG